MISARDRFLPGIKVMARKYGARVEPGERSAYCFKSVNGRERGVHVPYSAEYGRILRLLDAAFGQSPRKARVAETVSAVEAAGQEMNDAIGSSGFFKGNIYQRQDLGLWR